VSGVVSWSNFVGVDKGHGLEALCHTGCVKEASAAPRDGTRKLLDILDRSGLPLYCTFCHPFRKVVHWWKRNTPYIGELDLGTRIMSSKR